MNEPLYGSPTNHNILYRDTRNKLKKLNSEVEILLLRMISEAGVDLMKQMLMNNYTLTIIYDILKELIFAISEANEKGNFVIVLSSDAEAEATASTSKVPSVNQEIN
ncbi:hypothetical protein FXO38_00798 [Capsicum annuum]|nr:hypothetical protein FXO37_03197 [Capsicum annuum]KAF3683351.1 hypothetical protein FXO38_00798 [Capsicum annuum]